jgi:hypothetical protein
MTLPNAEVSNAHARWPALYGWLAGFAVGVIVLVIAPIWKSPSANYLIPNYWAFAVGLTFVVSVAAVFVQGRGWLHWALAISVGVLCAFMIRVQIDVSHDRTNHNLLPFELLGELIRTSFWAILGSAAGQLMRRIADREEQQGAFAPRWKRSK